MSEHRVTEEGVLPSGRRYAVRAGTGRDVLAASRTVNMQQDGQFAFVLAIVAQKVTLAEPGSDDLRPVTYEELLELGDDDVLALVGAAVSGKASPLATSPR